MLNDGAGSNNLSTTATTTVDIQVGPAIAVPATVAFTEGNPATTLAPAVTISDSNATTMLLGATVAVTGGTFLGDGDVLAFSTASTIGTNITASYNAATETLTLTGSDTFADYQQVLDSVTFVTGSDNPTDFGADPTRTVTWTIADDSTSNNTGTATSSIAITAVNDAPTLTGTAPGVAFTEGSTQTLSGTQAISDPDNQNLASATVRITGGTFAGDGDVLGFDTTGTSITASYNSTTETLTLTGSDTLADYQTVLDSVTFQSGDNPDDFGADPTRTVTWVVRAQHQHARHHHGERHRGQRPAHRHGRHQRVIRDRPDRDAVGRGLGVRPGQSGLGVRHGVDQRRHVRGRR